MATLFVLVAIDVAVDTRDEIVANRKEAAVQAEIDAQRALEEKQKQEKQKQEQDALEKIRAEQRRKELAREAARRRRCKELRNSPSAKKYAAEYAKKVALFKKLYKAARNDTCQPILVRTYRKVTGKRDRRGRRGGRVDRRTLDDCIRCMAYVINKEPDGRQNYDFSDCVYGLSHLCTPPTYEELCKSVNNALAKLN